MEIKKTSFILILYANYLIGIKLTIFIRCIHDRAIYTSKDGQGMGAP